VEPLEQLKLFNQRADELSKTRLIRDQALNLHFKMQWDAAGLITTTVDGPDEDDLRSYLLTFRQFVSPKEPVYLHRIFSLCHLHITNLAIRNNIAHARDVWMGQVKSQGFRVSFDDMVMSPEHVADLMINGHYFHSDPKLREELNRLLPYESALTKALFIDFVVNATNVLFYVDGALAQCFRDGHLSATPLKP
jgi:hypothetical protein